MDFRWGVAVTMLSQGRCVEIVAKAMIHRTISDTCSRFFIWLQFSVLTLTVVCPSTAGLFSWKANIAVASMIHMGKQSDGGGGAPCWNEEGLVNVFGAR